MFFNKKIDTFALSRKRQLADTLFEFGGRVEIFGNRQRYGRKFAQVTALLMGSPAFQQSCSCHIGFGLHGFNEVTQ